MDNQRPSNSSRAGVVIVLLPMAIVLLYLLSTGPAVWL
jgi:hypothetical protein